MSSGGYYKYRCKYWLTYNCPHWVWINNAPCAHCLADGRDSESNPGALCISRQVCVPQTQNGTMNYIIMDVNMNSDTDVGWRVKELPMQQLPISTGPEAVTSKATSGQAEVGFVPKRQSGYGWTGKEENIE